MSEYEKYLKREYELLKDVYLSDKHNHSVLMSDYCESLRELNELRKLKKTWESVCVYEKEKYLKYAKAFPDKISKTEIEHFKNLEKLAGDK